MVAGGASPWTAAEKAEELTFGQESAAEGAARGAQKLYLRVSSPSGTATHYPSRWILEPCVSRKYIPTERIKQELSKTAFL